MSDSGTVELSRDCGEEGTRHMPCHGKEDRNTILNELTCIDDTDNNDNTLKTSSDLLVDIHQKSVELIKAVPSDNKEDNNIDGTVDDSAVVQSKLSNGLKLNLDDVMMGDQPMMDEKLDEKPSMGTVEKKPKKKADGDDKFLKKITKKKSEKDDSDELMMGDQPGDDEVKPKEVTQLSTVSFETTETILSSTASPSTTETRLRRETEISVNEAQSTHSSVFTTEPSAPITTTIIANTTPSLQQSNKIEIKSTPKSHALDEHPPIIHHQKEIQEVHSSTDHFIPPMLLVRTQFSLSNGHGEHSDGPRKHIDDHETATQSTNDGIAKIQSYSTTNSAIVDATTTFATTVDLTTVEVTTPALTTAKSVSTTERQNAQILDVTTTQKTIPESPIPSTADVTAIKEEISTNPTTTTTVASTTVLELEETTKSATFATTTEQSVDVKKVTESTQLITESPRFRQPHAPKHSVEFHYKAPSPTPILTVETSYATITDTTTAAPQKQTSENVVTEHTDTTITTVAVTTSSVDNETPVRNNCSSNLDLSSDKPIDISRKEHSIKHHSTGGNGGHSDHNLNDHLAESNDNEDPCWTEENASADLSNSDVYQPYRPNRRRVLTKPETHSYIKKVLG